jgi:hypothetical protein
MSGNTDFIRLDSNGDGKLSRSELRTETALTAKFRDLDTDHDGNLSPTEFAASTAGSSSNATPVRP